MKHLFTALIALLFICAIVPPAEAGRPCVVNCPSMSPACVAAALLRCGGGTYDGSVIWMWEVPDPDQLPVIVVAPKVAPLPDDNFQVFKNPPHKDHPWSGENRITSAPLR